MISRHHYRIGEGVVFRIVKRSNHPGPRAEGIHPDPHGEDYVYEVDKYWTVSEIRSDGSLVLTTRRGKQHVLQSDHPRLRPARWWEKFLYRHRFPDRDPDHRASAPAS